LKLCALLTGDIKIKCKEVIEIKQNADKHKKSSNSQSLWWEGSVEQVNWNSEGVMDDEIADDEDVISKMG